MKVPFIDIRSIFIFLICAQGQCPKGQYWNDSSSICFACSDCPSGTNVIAQCGSTFDTVCGIARASEWLSASCQGTSWSNVMATGVCTIHLGTFILDTCNATTFTFNEFNTSDCSGVGNTRSKPVGQCINTTLSGATSEMYFCEVSTQLDESGSSRNKKGIGIGVGVCVGALVIIIVLLLFFRYRNKFFYSKSQAEGIH